MSSNGGSALDATFTGNADAPRAARSALTELRADLDDEQAYRLGLLVSEAVTNRVLDQASGGGRGRVHVEVSTDDHALHGTVADVDFDDERPAGSATAAARDLEAGMMGALADSWGSTRHADGEIAIWFEVLRGPAPTREQYGHRFAAALAAHREAHA